MQGTLVLNDVMLEGVNSVRDLSIFKKTSNHSAAHSISFDRIAVQVGLEWQVSGPGGNETFPVNATLAVQGVTLDLQTMLALDKRQWLQTTFGSVWDMVKLGRPAACFLKTILATAVTDFKIAFDSLITAEVSDPVGSSGAPSGLNYVVRQALAAALQLYGGFSEAHLAPYVCQKNLRAAFNSRLKAFLLDPENQLCPRFDYEAAGGIKLLNFSDSFTGIAEMINNSLHPDSHVQQLVASVTKNLGGRPGELVLSDGPIVNMTRKSIPHLPNIELGFRISNVSILNLDTLHDVVLLQPRDAYTVHNTAGFGGMKNQSRRPGIQADISLDFVSPSQLASELKADAQVKLDFQSLMAIMDSLAMVNTNKLLNLTFSRVSVPCAFGSLEDLAVKVLSIVADDLLVDIQCKKYEGACSQEILDIAQRSHNYAVRVEASQQFNGLLKEMLSVFHAASARGDLYKFVHSSHNSCWGAPHDPSLALTDPARDKLERRAHESLQVFMSGWFLPLLWLSALGGLGIAVLWLTRMVRKASVTAVDKYAGTGSSEQQASRAWTTPHSSMICFVVAVYFNISLFLIAHFHIGAEINIRITLLGVEVKQEAYQTLNVLQTVQKLKENKAYLLAVLIALFSIVWPYIKLFCLLVLVFLSPSEMSDRRREKYLFLMDRMGKYSMLDVYFIVLVYAFLQIEFGSQSNSRLLGRDFLKFQLEVMPCFGIVALILGVLLSIFLNQIALAMHRRCVERHEGQEPGEFLGNDREALCNHAWHVHVGTGFKQKMRRSGIVLIAMTMILCAMLMSIGWFLTFGDTEVHGVGGLLKTIQEKEGITQTYSFFSMAATTLQQARSQVRWDNYLGIILVMACQMVFAGLLPLLQVACMLVLWLKPLTLRSQKRLNLFIQSLSAVASMEVFLFAIMVGYLEIESLTEHFLAGAEDKANVREALQTANLWGIIDKAHFLSVDVAFHWGMVVLTWGATLYCISSSLIIEWSKHAEHDRLVAFRGQHFLEVETGDRGIGSSERMGLLDEAQAKLQCVAAVMKFMDITDSKGKEGTLQFWSECNGGGLPSLPWGSSAASLLQPLLSTDIPSPTLLPKVGSEASLASRKSEK